MQPQSSDPKFDFMLKNNQPAKGGGLALPRLNKPIKIGLAVIGGIILLVIISSTLSGRKDGATTDILGVLARGHETLRVTDYVQSQLQLQDPTTLALSSTVSSSLASDQQQLKAYLARNHAAASAAALAVDTDKSTDASLLSASQNNNLPAAYEDYLRGALARYQTDLQKAYSAAGPNGKTLLKSANDSATTLLNSPPLKS